LKKASPGKGSTESGGTKELKEAEFTKSQEEALSTITNESIVADSQAARGLPAFT